MVPHLCGATGDLQWPFECVLLLHVYVCASQVVQLGLEVQPAGPGASQVTLYYTGPGAPQSQALATFSVASDFSQWTRLGLSVTESQVSLYFNCELAGTASVARNPPQLSFDPNSTLYIGQAGPLVGTPLDVSTSLIWFMVYLYIKQLYIRQLVLFSNRNKT